MFVNVSLAKVSHMVRARIRAAGLCEDTWAEMGGRGTGVIIVTYHRTFVYTFYISAETKNLKQQNT